MARVRQGKRRRNARSRVWRRRTVLGLLAIPALYLFAALVGGLATVNRGWTEPDQGITIYLADNGVHADLVLPVEAGGLDWRDVLTSADVIRPPDGARWLAFGAGERAVYLETPTWADLRAQTALRALTRGERIMHVEWVADPAYSARQIRLRPEEYRRLWASIRAEFRDGRAQKIAHKGYGQADAFYLGIGKTNAFNTCNNWVASRLRLAGVKAPLWSPFTTGLTWRYRKADQST